MDEEDWRSKVQVEVAVLSTRVKAFVDSQDKFNTGMKQFAWGADGKGGANRDIQELQGEVKALRDAKQAKVDFWKMATAALVGAVLTGLVSLFILAVTGSLG